MKTAVGGDAIATFEDEELPAACSPAAVFQCVTIQNHLQMGALSLFFFVSAHPQVPLSCTKVHTSVVEHQSGGGNGPTSPQGSEWFLRQVGERRS